MSGRAIAPQRCRERPEDRLRAPGRRPAIARFWAGLPAARRASGCDPILSVFAAPPGVAQLVSGTYVP